MKKYLSILLLFSFSCFGQILNPSLLFEFGRNKVEPNTLIGGVSSTVTSASLFAAKLGISASRVVGFAIVGSDVQAKVTGGTYVLSAGNSFDGNTSITYFKDLDGLCTSITGTAAFRNATNLTEVYFPSATRATANDTNGNAPCFLGCSKLANVYMPSLTTVEWSMFQGCTLLTSIDLPSATSVRQQGFFACTSLASATIPNLIEIRVQGFNGCSSITAVNFPLVTSILSSAFQNCVSLNSMIFSASYTAITSSTFQGCTSLTTVTLNGVTSIAQSAFFGCTNLVTLNLPNLTTIVGGVNTAHYIFSGTKIVDLNFPLLTSVSGSFVFGNMPTVRTIYMPLCTSLGNTSGNDNVFTSIGNTATGTVTVATVLSTNNSGSPDGDLATISGAGVGKSTIVYF